MPGVLRPYTLVDVLSTINNQNGQGSMGNPATLTVPLSTVAEADETASSSDTAFASTQTGGALWNGEVWCAGTWG